MNFKIRREDMGLSLEEMASLLGVSYSTLRNWESKRTRPRGSMNELERYRKVYGMTISEFVNASEDEPFFNKLCTRESLGMQ